jgi:serpin B
MRRLIFLTALLTAACSSSGPTAPPAPLTGLPRALTTAEGQIRTRSNAFAFELFRRTAAARDSNSFISPLSVSMALGMTMNGAANATLDSMRSALGFGGMPLTDINAGYRGLIDLLTGLDASTEMRIANSIWFRKGMIANPTFVTTVDGAFDANARALDFTLATAPDSINRWASAATAGRIPRVIETISGDQVMFLLNAIYFKGRWRQQFDRAETRDAAFAAAFGGAQTVPLMSRQMTVRHRFQASYSAVDLGYGNDAFAMTLLLPAPGRDVHDLVDSLSSGLWAEITGGLDSSRILVAIPRFTLEYERQLKDDLTAMGMGIAFEDGIADFRNLFLPTLPGPFIEFVKHQTFVQVNEEGTEAAAVTSVGVGVTSMPPSFIADRPFVLVIRERFSGTILFMGKILRVPE